MMSIPPSPTPAEVSIIYSGDEYFHSLFEQIDRAQYSIFIESYIFNLDPIGLKVLAALEAAVQRGVHIRLLVDGVGSYNWLHRLHLECAARKIPLRVYHPLPFGIDFWRHISWKQLNGMLWLFRRINKRNHRKVSIFDSEVTLMGSFNISKAHSETYLGKKAWRDSGILAKNFSDPSDIRTLSFAFNQAWQSAKYFRRTNFSSILRRRRISKMTSARFRLNSRTYWRFRLMRDLNRKFQSAENQILITNAYFLPRKSILRNLRRAARRGVHVQLLLPEITDVWFVREASRSLYQRLLKSGVRIFEYQPRILHAKTIIVDDWATIGSHNLNHRSMNHDLEVEAVIVEPPLLSSLKKQWQIDLKSSREVTLKEMGNISLSRRMMGRVLYWFRFWI